MMEINKENINKWLQDLEAGKLNPEQEEAVYLFLENHPDFIPETHIHSLTEAFSENPVFDGKENLKVSVQEQTYAEYLIIGKAENILSEEEEDHLKKIFVINPVLKQDLEWYLKTRIVSEEIEYPFKEQLYREEKVFSLMPVLRMAAAFLLLAGLGSLLYFFVFQNPGNFALRGESFSSPAEKFRGRYVQNFSGKETKENNFERSGKAQRPRTVLYASGNQVKWVKQDIDPLNTFSLARHSNPRLPLFISPENPEILALTRSRNEELINRTEPEEVLVNEVSGEALMSEVKSFISGEPENKVKWYHFAALAGKGLSKMTGRPFKIYRLESDAEEDGLKIVAGNYIITRKN